MFLNDIDLVLLVKKAGGYIIQIMPDTPDQIISLIENRIKESKSVTEMLENGMTLEEIAIFWLVYICQEVSYK